MPSAESSLRIALLAYRGNPLSGGQGVYVRHLSRELTELGHRVSVFSGPPYPQLDDGAHLVEVPSLDLYREPDPFRIPRPREFRDRIDLLEFALMCLASFPEPRTFGMRAWRLLRHRAADFDVFHDNQCLAPGILRLQEAGLPLLTTIHHPITVDRDLELAHATSPWRRFTLRRWYAFLRTQARVARRLRHIVTVSESSRRDIAAQMGVDAARISVVPVGVDHRVFRPLPGVSRVPGRIMTTTSSDVPLKGLVPLLEAMAKLRTERDVELVVIGRPKPEGPVARTVERLGLHQAVRFERGIDDDRLVELYAEAEIAVVPSLYEGFSLPAIEAMACGVPLVATTGGALPEVVGTSGQTALLVPPGDPEALAAALRRALDEPRLRERIGHAGRRRVLDRFTWRATAEATAEHYRRVVSEAASREPAAAGVPAC